MRRKAFLRLSFRKHQNPKWKNPNRAQKSFIYLPFEAEKLFESSYLSLSNLFDWFDLAVTEEVMDWN